ncbi:hypothetical protein [Oceanobacillus halotolerans]|nr:hypothetical protein [Oceanobacillus halotolerans]
MNKNKLIVIGVVFATIVVLLLGWFYLQDVMIEHDIDEKQDNNWNFH